MRFYVHREAKYGFCMGGLECHAEASTEKGMRELFK